MTLIQIANMNERIKELEKQCWNHRVDGVLVDGHLHFDTQKFAELIVRECAEQIISKGTDWVDFAPSQTGVRPEYWDMAQQIKEYFGVEE